MSCGTLVLISMGTYGDLRGVVISIQRLKKNMIGR